MNDIKIELENALQAIADASADASGQGELNAIKAKFMSPDSALMQLQKSIKTLPNDQKAEVGKLVSSTRTAFFDAFQAKTDQIKDALEAEQLAAESVDVTEAIKTNINGARHPLETLQEEIADFFVSLGWSIEYGPEVESEWFNFDALNFGPDHPARQMQDTFYIKGAVDATKLQDNDEPTAETVSNEFANAHAFTKIPHQVRNSESESVRNSEGVKDSENANSLLNMVLRTHTSPVQARTLLKKGVPVYVAAPGRVFRTDELDATHTPVFNQVEGLAIDKHLSMADMKGVLDAFAQHMFGKNAKTRLRPSFFPFTEPSAEMDVWYEAKSGGAGWIEWGGCGMVHPNVLLATGVDPDVYSGFAFGIGIERTLMFRHFIQDMHDIVEGDVRFSRQFVTGGLHA
ncbi:MAG: phenylalanine--tRNA ligase subunit alpha [Bifidobacteriaceae bacterium]|jgi:phenylalanyl-tRNA synthetase alpha chain|nr:phenylalanine--tRNA ligase subunit alpha [Bifidobacteriaceae bacterium]